jgi:hypothetical protein
MYEYGWLGWSSKYSSYFQGNGYIIARTSVTVVAFDLLACETFFPYCGRGNII